MARAGAHADAAQSNSAVVKEKSTPMQKMVAAGMETCADAEQARVPATSPAPTLAVPSAPPHTHLHAVPTW